MALDDLIAFRNTEQWSFSTRQRAVGLITSSGIAHGANATLILDIELPRAANDPTMGLLLESVQMSVAALNAGSNHDAGQVNGISATLYDSGFNLLSLLDSGGAPAGNSGFAASWELLRRPAILTYNDFVAISAGTGGPLVPGNVPWLLELTANIANTDAAASITPVLIGAFLYRTINGMAGD